MEWQSHSQDDHIYTVSRLNNEVRFLLEDTFPFVWVEGEISNFSAPRSGHWYFCLKDAASQVRCAMFKSSQRGIHFAVKDGLHVLIKARVSLYENRGEFQLIAEQIEERGEGKLRRAFELLKQKLAALGLFEASHKKTLPLFPQCIGVITSATGAAIQDILTVLKRRYPCVPVIIYPTLVQGSTAAPAIVNAIQIANRRKECDILILARGGGSLEDLWPFNEESVAQAIYHSGLPIISGVGHEVDFTISDFVADQRAPTPSAAAEICTPDQFELLQNLARYHQQLTRCMRQKLSLIQQHINWAQKHLQQQHPKRRLIERMQRVDFYEVTLVQQQLKRINQLQQQVKHFQTYLQHKTPLSLVHRLQHQLVLMQQQLLRIIASALNKHQAQLTHAAGKLDALSPLATLKRGYAIASHGGQILHSAHEVKIGEQIQVKLFAGNIECRVEKINTIIK